MWHHEMDISRDGVEIVIDDDAILNLVEFQRLID